MGGPTMGQLRTNLGKSQSPCRWADRGEPGFEFLAIITLIDLQAEYQAWLDSLPENLQSSAVAEQLEAICELDLDSLQDVEPPRGFGRD